MAALRLLIPVVHRFIHYLQLRRKIGNNVRRIFDSFTKFFRIVRPSVALVGNRLGLDLCPTKRLRFTML